MSSKDPYASLAPHRRIVDTVMVPPQVQRIGTARERRTRALDMLEARSRGVAELRRLLLRKREPEAEVDAAIERLKANGLLDDANFARQLTRSKALGAGRQELAASGVKVSGERKPDLRARCSFGGEVSEE